MATKTATKKKDTRLSQQLSHSQQSWYYKAIWDFMGEKLSVSIRRNAYDFQSHRCVSIYEPEKKCWNALCKLSFDESAPSFKVFYQDRPAADIKMFEADEAELLKQAALILG